MTVQRVLQGQLIVFGTTLGECAISIIIFISDITINTGIIIIITIMYISQ